MAGAGSVFKDMLELFDTGGVGAQAVRQAKRAATAKEMLAKPVPNVMDAALAPAADPAAAKDPFASLWKHIEGRPNAQWRPTSGGRIFADTEKGDLNIVNADYRKQPTKDYLLSLEKSAQGRGLGNIRFAGPAAERLGESLRDAGYSQEGKTWAKKLALAGAAGTGAAVAASPDEAQAADLKAIEKMFSLLEKSDRRHWFETPEGKMFAEVVNEADGKYFNVTSALTNPRKRGKGEFINNFFAIEAEAKKRGYAGIKAELVINPKLADFLKRSGYPLDQDADLIEFLGDKAANYTKKFGPAGAGAAAGAVALSGDEAQAQAAGGYEVDLGNGKTARFPPGTTMEQVQEAVDAYRKETAGEAGEQGPVSSTLSKVAAAGQAVGPVTGVITGAINNLFGTGGGGDRTVELFKEGVGSIKRGGEQLAGDVPAEHVPPAAENALNKFDDMMRRAGQNVPYRDQGPPTAEQQQASERSYQKLAGAGNIASGIWDVLTSPWGAVSAPLSKVDIPTGTGDTIRVPEKVTEGVLGLFSPFAALKGAKSVPWSTLSTNTRNAITNIAAKMPSSATVASKTGIGSHPDKDLAKALIRQEGGVAARETATTLQNLEKFRVKVNSMPDHERMDLYRYIEGRSVGQNITDPATQGIADQLRTEFLKRKTVLQGMSSTQTAHFIDDYFPHMWNDPRAATAMVRAWRQSRQGSGGNLKKRDLPTIADGLARGLTLKTTDPIEATMMYVSNMDRFIATNKVVEEGRSLGKIKYYIPGNKHIPDGWTQLEGRLSLKPTKVPGVVMRAYAPKEFSTIYNNFISKGFHEWERPGQIYDAALKASNSVTALELGLSGFHAVTMANESMISRMATGIRNVTNGSKSLNPRQIMGGLKAIATAPVAPYMTARRGRQLQNVYLGQTPGSAHMQKISELLTKAGGRGAGFSHAPDYKFSAMNSYWTSFKRGALKAEAQLALANIKANPVLGTAKEAIRAVGRTLATVAEPLFGHYIPYLKNGAFHDAMSSWLHANPSATQAQQLAEARRVWDSIDNRFGELVQDNIFINKLFKQSAMLAMRSWSWNVGTVREIGGGVRDVTSIARGKDMTERTAYVIAMTLQVALMNAIYQKLKTGKDPESIDDLMAGRTGGEAPGVRVPALPRGPGMPNVRTGRQAQVEERAMIPGYQKDVFGWYEDWLQEAKNKVATAPRMAGDLMANRDWKNDPIFNPESSAPEWLKQFFEYVGQSLGPISIKQLMQGEKQGSNISTPEMLGGVRPAPGYLQDPEGYAEAKHRRAAGVQKRKQFLEQRRQRQYGGSEE